jgi:hypothetical protein
MAFVAEAPAVGLLLAACIALQVLGFLNQKRPVDVEREAVFLQADAFAVLVQMDFVAADGEHCVWKVAFYLRVTSTTRALECACVPLLLLRVYQPPLWLCDLLLLTSNWSAKLSPCAVPCCPTGTVQTMGKLLKAPERRVAAVMTLCALVQRCK